MQDALMETVPIWIDNPHQLITWRTMEQFPGNSLSQAVMVLETIKCGWVRAKHKGDAEVAAFLNRGRRLLDEQERGDTSTDLGIAEAHLNQCGLLTSAETVREYRAVLLRSESPYYAEVSSADVIARVEEIERTINREMQTILFMYIPHDRAKRYNKQEPFGTAVSAHFPSAIFEFQESGNCYAAARFTGCVFHLMRAWRSLWEPLPANLG